MQTRGERKAIQYIKYEMIKMLTVVFYLKTESSYSVRLKVTCALWVMSSRCCDVRCTAASVVSRSQGSEMPGPPVEKDGAQYRVPTTKQISNSLTFSH